MAIVYNRLYSRLGAITSSGIIGTADVLYSIFADSAVVSTIAVCNRASTSATYRIALQPTSSFGTGGFIVYDATVPANDTIFLTLGLVIDNNLASYLLCSASATTVSFTAFGVDNVIVA